MRADDRPDARYFEPRVDQRNRHGRAIARLIPEEAMQRNGQAKAIERLKARRGYDELMMN
jgi:hypothetical protein